MNNINFNQDGGFRLSTNIMSAVQAAYSLFNSLGWIGGNFTIISGCEITGSNVSDGVVFINGEVFNFKGGNLGTYVIIRETVTVYPFQNGTVKPVIRERFVSFGTSTPDKNFLWSDFKRLFPTKDIQAFKDDHNTRITNLEGKQAFAVGMIIRYDQPLSVPPPAGWIDWNPVNEQGRVWVSRSESDSDFGLGAIGGEKKHNLTESELPAHKHKFTVRTPYNGNLGGFAGGGNQFKDEIWETQTVGGNQAHNNLQPYVAVRFIKCIRV